MKRGIILMVYLVLQPSALSAEFAGGTGEPDDPYQIATAEQLIGIGTDPNLLDKSFVLVADIDLDPNLPGGRVFEGALIAATFKGVFGGGPGGTLMRCEVQAQITGEITVGGLVGRSSDGQIIQRHVCQMVSSLVPGEFIFRPMRAAVLLHCSGRLPLHRGLRDKAGH